MKVEADGYGLFYTPYMNQSPQIYQNTVLFYSSKTKMQDGN